MEHIGTIKAAGWKAKKSGEGKACVMELEKPKWSYYLFDPAHQKLAEENIGKQVKVVYEMSEDGMYRNLKSVELITEIATLQSPTGQLPAYEAESPQVKRASIEGQVALYVFAELYKSDASKVETLLPLVMQVLKNKITALLPPKGATETKVAILQPATTPPSPVEGDSKLGDTPRPPAKPDLEQRKIRIMAALATQGFKTATEIKQFLSNQGFETARQLNEAEIARLEEVIAKFPKQEKLE